MRLICLLFAVMVAAPAWAKDRLALVIGNQGYSAIPALQKARGDANAMSETLAGLGFDVTLLLDANRQQMNQGISTFTGKLDEGDTALVFFAGHGVQIDGENYLLPVGIGVSAQSSEDYVRAESIPLSDLLARIKRSGAAITLAFLDACRDNPFASTTGRSIGGTRGLARIAAPQGTFVVYSAGADQQALDRLSDQDTDRNSVFTRLLLPKLGQDGLELRDMVSQLRVEVRDLARTQNHDQFPAYYDELVGEFYFAAQPQDTPGPPARGEPGAGDAGVVRSAFDLAHSIGTVDAYEAFLDIHGDSNDFSVALARRLLDKQKQDGPPTADPPGATPEAPPSAPPPTPSDDVADDVADQREIVRATQRRLSALGCDAGAADGVIGARTRQAFAAFLRDGGENLPPTALGTRSALDALNARSGTVCKVAAAPARSINGSWEWSAKCPLFIRAWGGIRFSDVGNSIYRHSINTNLGHQGSGTTIVQGLSISGTHNWSDGRKSTYRGTLSQDLKSYSGSDSVGCRFTARKKG